MQVKNNSESSGLEKESFVLFSYSPLEDIKVLLSNVLLRDGYGYIKQFVFL